MLTALIVVFCGMLSKLAGLLFGPSDGARARETVSATQVAAMSLPLGALLAFTAWIPGSLRDLMEQAASIVRGYP
jgi:hypothetical protein